MIMKLVYIQKCIYSYTYIPESILFGCVLYPSEADFHVSKLPIKIQKVEVTNFSLSTVYNY